MSGHSCPCGSWTAGSRFTFRGLASKVCEKCAARAEMISDAGIAVRNVNREGLGDRIGLAIEAVRGPTHYAKGSTKPIANNRVVFVAYWDGAETLRRDSWDDAYKEATDRLARRSL